MTANEVSVESLSLRIAGLNAPFTLIGSERDFGPEDWAWEFLRLSSDYQSAYMLAKAGELLHKGDFAGAIASKARISKRIKSDENTCRSRFGLSTWLDPKERLPKLSRGESWFYPLTDCTNRPADSFLPVTRPGLFGPEPLIPLNEASPSNIRKANIPCGQVASPIVWFAIDCSVPPAGQMATVDLISKIRLSWLQSRGSSMQDDFNFEISAPAPSGECDKFDQGKFKFAARQKGGINTSEYWLIIRVDVCKSVSKQISHLNKELTLINSKLLKAQKVDPFIPQRLRDSFVHRDDDGSTFSDGDFLKQRAICAQLSLAGLNEAEIVQYIEKNSPKCGNSRILPGSKRDEWNNAMMVRVQRYVEDGIRFVNGDYRRLIHAQKP